MAFEIKIKPLVLFDLEDKINRQEERVSGSGKEFYERFLSQLSHLPEHEEDALNIYKSVREYTTPDASCKLFYMVNEETVYIMGVL